MRCNKCSQVLPPDCFYVSNRTMCKECIKAAVRAHRSANAEHYNAFDRERANDPARVSARQRYRRTEAFRVSHSVASKRWETTNKDRKHAIVTLNNALRDKRIERQPCFVCGERAEAHHPDYSAPLAVSWLCDAHHKQVHKEHREHLRKQIMGAMTLFQISAQYRELAERLGDLDIDEATISDTLEAEGGALADKGSNIAFVARNLKATAAAIKEAEAAMCARRKAIENRAARLEKYLLDGMKFAGVQKIDSPYFAIKIAKNPPAVDIYEPGLVPVEYMVQPPAPPPVPDKRLIGMVLKGDVDVPGCRLTQSDRLEIR